MLVHHRVAPSIEFSGTHLYTWVERSTVRVKCLAQEHNAMSPARAQTWTARSGGERTNHEPTAPPSLLLCRYFPKNGVNLIWSHFVFAPFLQTDVYVFLFTDLLLITKAKKGDKFKVIKPVSESYLDHYNGSADVFKTGGAIGG